jgi:hypothetical protein
MRRWRGIGIASCVVIALGCCSCVTEEEHRPVYPVRGRLVCQGRPVAGVQVTFHLRDDSSAPVPVPTGQTDEGGWYTLSTYAAADGAPAGRYTVTVHGQQADGRPLPVRYARATTSGLHAVVKEGTNQLPAFEVKK